ncbi:FitA-like ribbon-helix-helix domain-containing protein [Bifidobacterium avesanii]|uniref:DNA-binding protein n=1 Tax=Bifidobacterium avesanii TaxID=1798157 RepID=A0A7K3TFI6_9BIFI|nr:DNA-binding protein [Bifidobacterium avesanii]KAB8294363.1 plasmid stability protein [Bifidobacterium avesanii]NEG77802.1 DNA-binding protein [Bifidobacterium avesanii]
MGTITIRKVPDEQIQLLKDVAAKNNRSMEAEARSILEEYTAQYVSQKIMSSTDLMAEMQRLLDGEGLDPNEELTPPRDPYMRPVDLG